MTAVTETLILEQLAAINHKLEFLLVPVAVQSGKQIMTMSKEEIRAWNKLQTEKAKLMQQGRGK
jgi:hypothetical protein